MSEHLEDAGRLPGRGEVFADTATRAVWAAITTLGAAAQHQVLAALRDLLACVDGVTTEEARVRAAVVALREAAAFLGHSPSVEDYRAHQKEKGWPADGSVRRWLGGSWNDCLRRAHLDTVPDGDVIASRLGPAFTEEEVVEAIRAYMDENDGAIPTIYAFVAWARRPDVRRRFARLPLSYNTVTRLFGGWVPALEAALGGEGLHAKLPRSAVGRVRNYFVTDDKIREALQQVADRVGRSPRAREYVVERERILAETIAAGAPLALPSLSTIQKHHGTWDAALVDAGLEPLGGRHTRSNPRTRTAAGPRIPDADALAVLREAFAELGHPFTTIAFKKWRAEQLVRDREAGRIRRLPTYDLYHSRFGSWDAAVQRALDDGAEHDAAAA